MLEISACDLDATDAVFLLVFLNLQNLPPPRKVPSLFISHVDVRKHTVRLSILNSCLYCLKYQRPLFITERRGRLVLNSVLEEDL